MPISAMYIWPSVLTDLIEGYFACARDYHHLQPGDEVMVVFDSLLLIVPKKLEWSLETRKPLIDQLLGR
jgi:hypothetical protein